MKICFGLLDLEFSNLYDGTIYHFDRKSERSFLLYLEFCALEYTIHRRTTTDIIEIWCTLIYLLWIFYGAILLLYLVSVQGQINRVVTPLHAYLYRLLHFFVYKCTYPMYVLFSVTIVPIESTLPRFPFFRFRRVSGKYVK